MTQPSDPITLRLDRKAAAAQRVVLRAYERGRLVEGILTALVALGLVLPGVLLATSWVHAFALAALLALLVVAAIFRGGSLARMALPATALGLLPLVCALGAARFGHVCTPGGCVSLCVPICTAAGIASGAWLGVVAARGPEPLRALGFGGAVLIVVGAIGCSCVGMSGFLAMSAGVACASALTSAYRRAY